ncbi:Auxin response factor [Artemisia annua]|uniref:Auxin response factor n=1 Tax=Artemisia annua TaxID=35608 RepID=A0A2U1KKC5_ARTAN|nr:Auxin response factor [Artemisia annua]
MRVMVEKAKQDTNQVFAQINLMLEINKMRMPLRRNLLSFCTTLAALDIGIHGGYSVLKRRADEQLPALAGQVRETPNTRPLSQGFAWEQMVVRYVVYAIYKISTFKNALFVPNMSFVTKVRYRSSLSSTDSAVDLSWQLTSKNMGDNYTWEKRYHLHFTHNDLDDFWP